MDFIYIQASDADAFKMYEKAALVLKYADMTTHLRRPFLKMTHSLELAIVLTLTQLMQFQNR